MGFDSNSLPDSFKRRIQVSARKAMGDVAATFEEAESKRERTEEKDMHRLFEQWLLLNQLPYVHSRMDRATTIRKGWPDYTITKNQKVYLVEFKTATGQLSPEQNEVIGELLHNGCEVLISTDVGNAIQNTRAFFNV